MKYLVLLLMLAALAGLYYRMASPVDVSAETLPATGGGFEVALPDARDARLLLNRPASDFQSLTQKALFNEDRRVTPPKPKVQRKPVPRPQQKLDVLALGIAVSDEGFLAVVKERRNGEIRRMRLNEKINGWELVSITREGFSYRKEGREVVIPFKQQQEAGHE